MVELCGAFAWDCPECGAENFIKATEGLLPEDEALVAQGDDPEGDYDIHFETADAVGTGEELASTYLVTRVLVAPSFVECSKCKKMSAAKVKDGPEEDEEL